MKHKLKPIYRKYFKGFVLSIKKIVNTQLNIGNKKQCYVCKKRFNHFGKFRNGSKGVNEYIRNLQIVGSDVDNFMCYFCGSHDRTRHLFMFFDKLNMWEKFRDSNILHVAPELMISNKIKSLSPSKYIMGDLFPKNDEHRKIDVTEIPFEDSSFDIIICNHVLEHVPDYKKALHEIHRVLKVDGIAILQTPYSLLLTNNFEDEGISDPHLSLIFYGQEDHVRFFSKRHFFSDLVVAGFKLNVIEHERFFSDSVSSYYGVNKKEDLIQVIKTK